MTARFVSAAGLVAGLVALPGCGPARLDVTQTAEISPGNPKLLDLNAQSKPQTITVEYESTPSPVEVGIYRAADAEEAEMISPHSALKYQKGETAGSVAVEVPANTAVKVAVGSLKGKTNVKLRVTNQK